MLSDERIDEMWYNMRGQGPSRGVRNALRQIARESAEAMRERCSEYARANANRMFSGELAEAILNLPVVAAEPTPERICDECGHDMIGEDPK